MGYFPQDAWLSTDVKPGTTSQSYKQVFHCKITMIAEATDLVGNLQELNLEGIIEAIPTPEYLITAGSCSIAKGAFVPETCQASVPAGIPYDGRTPENAVPLVGTGDVGRITYTVARSYAVSGDNSNLFEGYYVQEFHNAGGCTGGVTSIVKTQTSSPSSRLYELNDGAEPTMLCYRPTLWEEDPGGRGQNWYADDDDKIGSKDMFLYFKYEKVEVNALIGEDPPCSNVLKAFAEHLRPASSDLQECLVVTAARGISPSASLGPGGVLMMPVLHEGTVKIFGIPLAELI